MSLSLLVFAVLALTTSSVVEAADCSFYRDTVASQVPSCPFVGTMYRKCADYEALEKKLTPLGQKWSASVRQCLQDTMSTWLSTNANQADCKTTTKAFFDAHLPCYLTKGPVSYCDLPAADQFKIVWNARDMLFSKKFKSVISNGAKLELECL
eukprot:TRINITY_DN2739_c0_g1_i1.p1 TRINITY_DN2739_c0_g1~~TRINITY_DN2739_c0_g1_i1.p1  ORF type:complete len:153 (+),score=16.26 TRINITY_DN2739_c0_g1_i1:195-653(+)